MVQEEGILATSVFYISDDQKRVDGCLVQSVNWEDDDAAIAFTLSQRKTDGTRHFPGGVAILPRTAVDEVARLPIFGDVLFYDREPTPENRYHGNLALRAAISKRRRQLLAAVLTAHVASIVAPPS